MTDKSYLVTAANRKSINDVAADIQSLAENRKEAVNIGDKFEIARVLQMSCKAAFAEAVRKLPSVLAVEEEQIVGINQLLDKKPKL